MGKRKGAGRNKAGEKEGKIGGKGAVPCGVMKGDIAVPPPHLRRAGSGRRPK
jgi:hypothetical protein